MSELKEGWKCSRCSEVTWVGEDGFCEDCREIIELRKKVAKLEAENTILRETLEKITNKPSYDESTTKRLEFANGYNQGMGVARNIALDGLKAAERAREEKE
jgi:hypothetical protein